MRQTVLWNMLMVLVMLLSMLAALAFTCGYGLVEWHDDDPLRRCEFVEEVE